MTRIYLVRRLCAVMPHSRALGTVALSVLLMVTCGGPLLEAQTTTALTTEVPAITAPATLSGSAPAAEPSVSQADASAPQQTLAISLEEAIRRAQGSDALYRSAVTDRAIAGLDHSIARSALLPSVVYHNQFIYTQGVRTAPVAPTAQLTSSSPVFIANNTVHEYISQGSVTETLGARGVSALLRASAASAVAVARQEIARRGLIATVSGYYYSLIAANEKLLVAGRAALEANRFGDLTRKLESGREVAHADVVKSDLQRQQRGRDLADATLAAERAKLDLAVLLFADPHTPYTLSEEFAGIHPLPERAAIYAAAQANNPDLRAAMAALQVAGLAVNASRAAYLPDLVLNYSYGIDAPQFAVNNREHISNLGYSVTATLDIPVWDWLATHDRVKQDVSRRDLAKVQLSYTQRRLIASLDELYAEARVSRDLFTSLGQSVETARESQRLVNLRYSAGEATVLEVVDAQNALLLAETARVDGATRYQTALANLQTLTGTLP